MAALETPPGLDAIVAKLKAHRATLIGGGVLIILGVLIYNLVQSSAEKEKYEPWRALVGGDDPRFLWELEPDQLANATQQTDHEVARGLAEYWRVLKGYEEAKSKSPIERRAAANEVAAFYKAYGEHPLLTTPFPSGDPALGATPPGVVLERQIRVLEAAGTENPTPSQNASRPSSTNSLTIVTGLGDITISLYPDLAPESCRFLREHLAKLEGSFIVKAMEDRYVEIGSDADGNYAAIEEEDEDHPPYEDNGLSLYKGTVTFLQPPFSDLGQGAALKVWLEDSFSRDEQFTVLGEVTAGLDILEDIARMEKDSTVAGNVGDPVELQELRLQLPDLPSDEADEAQDPESDSSEEDESEQNAGAGEGDGAGEETEDG